MPKGTRVHRCVDKLTKQGREKGSAIAICQSSTKQGYQSGNSLKESMTFKEFLAQQEANQVDIGGPGASKNRTSMPRIKGKMKKC